ncbi:MAG: hypothetical protein PVH65_07330, partial [Chloroflexota bacterium]
MPARIDWKAEDEQAWGEIQPEQETNPGGRRPGRRLRRTILALLLVVVLAAIAYWQVSRFLNNSGDEVEEALLASHALVLQAAADGDDDLLRGLIFDRLQEWTDAQALLVEEGLWLDRRPLDLYLGGGIAPAETEVTLDPALRQAVVTMTLPYQVGGNDPEAAAIRLRQVFFYRYEDERWLLNPPTAAFWGLRQEASGRYLTLSYPERDGELGRRLAADLEAVLGQACHTITMIDCPDDLHLAVDLVANPAVLAELADPAWQLAADWRISLPTPTLVGLPEDAAAYRALYRGYAQRVLARLIAGQTLASETKQPLLALTLMDRILQQLGLQARAESPGPLIFDGQAMAGRLEALWNSDAPLEEQLKREDVQTIGVLVDFLATVWSQTPETEMLRLLALSGSWQEWLQRLAPETGDDAFVDSWERYMAQVHPRQSTQSWPDEVVLLMCDLGVIGSASLYRYDPDAAVMSRVLSGREFIRMEPLPDGDGVLLTEQLLSQAGQRVYLWRNGRLSPYQAENDRPGSEDMWALQRTSQARPARQNDLAAVSGDGRWLAELGDGVLILSLLG